MKTTQTSIRRCPAVLLGIIFLIFANHSSAATLTWDADTATPGAQDGSGTWAGGNWWDGSANTTWAAANDAVFGAGVDGGIYYLNVAGLPSPSAQTISFSNSGYILTNGTPLSVTLSSTTGGTLPQIRVNAGKTATVGTNVIIESSVTTTPFYIGQNSATAGGTLNIANGGIVRGSASATAAQGHVFIDGDGTVVNVMAGGTLAERGASSGLIVGGQSAGTTNAIKVDGGTVTVAGTTASTAGLLIGFTGNAIITVTNGGTVTLPATGNGVYFARFNSSGTFNLDGGTLNTPIVKKGSGVGAIATFNFNGGTLKPTAASATFMIGLDRANVRNGGAVIDTSGFAITIGQALEHSNIGGDAGTDGGLIKLGAGVLTLAGPNTYNGGTIVSNGTLRAISLGSGNVAVRSGAALSVGNTNVVTALAVGGNLDLNDSTLVFDVTSVVNGDTLTVAGNLTAAGTTTISLPNQTPLANGTYPLVYVTNTLGATAGNFTVASVAPKTYTIACQVGTPSKVVLQVSGPLASETWAGDGSANQWNINTGLDWYESGSSLTLLTYPDNIGVIFDDSAVNLNVDISTTVSPTSVSVNSSNSYTFSGSGGIAGATSLVKNGAGTNLSSMLTLATANSYSGGTTLLGSGVLTLANSAALGTGPLALQSARVGSLPTVMLTGGITITNPIAINGTTGREAIFSTNGNNTLSGPITITNGTSAIYVSSSGASGSVFAISNSIAASGWTNTFGLRGLEGNFGLVSGQITLPGIFQVLGSANWTIASTGNTWTEARMSSGSGGFVLGASDALAAVAKVTWDSDSSGALDLAGFNQTVAGLSCASTASSPPPAVGNSSTTSDSLLKINGNGYTFVGTLNDAIGAGSRKLSVEFLSGTQTLTGDNTYSGTTTINAGATLNVGTGGATGSINSTAAITNNGNLVFSRVDPVLITNFITGSSSGNLTLSGAVIYRPPNSGALGGITNRIGAAQSDTAHVELTGGLTLTNPVTFRTRNSAAVDLTGCFLNASGTNYVSPPTDLTVGSGGDCLPLQSDSGRLVLTVGVNNSSRSLVLLGAGNGEIQGALGTNTPLQKRGAGVWTLTGSSPTAGPTLVSDGTLVVNGSLTATTNIVTIAGGTLAGNGTIAGPVTVEAAGTLAPGNSVGTLTINSNLTLQGTAIMEIARNGGVLTLDQVAGINTLTCGGTLVITNVGGSALQVGDSFQLFAATNYAASTFANIVYPDGYTFTDTLATDGTITVLTVPAGGSPTLNFTPSGGNWVFNWSGSGFKLQTQTNTLAVGLSTKWSDVPGGDTSGVSVPAPVSGNPAVFFRLISTP